MELSGRRYPIGIQNFEQLRTRNCVYVDKTELVYKLVNTDQIYFFSRPRRFGKSLLVSTLEAYFQGKKELFEGLAMERLEQEWEVCPVLHVDFSLTKYTELRDLTGQLNLFLSRWEEIYGKKEEEEGAAERLQGIILRAYAKTGKPVVVLIDEYDAPLLDSNSDALLQQQLRNEMRKFFSPLKGLGQYLRFLFITGISKFSQLSIFSELNNLQNISMRDDFSALYKNYWFSTGTPTFLIDILRHADFDVRALEGVEATDEQFDAPTEQITSPIPVLYQSGYLTIKGYDRNFQIYRLAYPNGEVRKGFIESLLPSYVHLPAQNNTFYVVSFLRDLMKGDVESCLERTRSFFASIPNDLENKTEKHYQTIFYLLFRLMGQYVESEVKSSVGRADVVVQLQDVVYVFEFKYDGTPEEALAQIDSKQYAIPYRADGRRVVKIGVNFDSATRTIGGWKIAKAD